MGYCYIKFPKSWKWLWNWIMGSDWKNFEAYDRKNLGVLEAIVGRNMDIKEDSGKSLERSKNYRGIVYHLREGMYYHKQNAGGNINVKGNSDEVSKEMMNILLDTREKVTFIIKWQELC